MRVIRSTRASLLLAIVLLLAACSQPDMSGHTAADRLRSVAVGSVFFDADGTEPAHTVVARVPLAVSASASNAEKAAAFLAAYGEAIGVDPGSVTMVDEVPGDASMGDDSSVVVYQQNVDGVPVAGSDVRVEVSMGDAEAESASARVVTSTSGVTTTPTVTAAMASAVVDAMPGLHSAGAPTLMLLDPAFFTGTGSGTLRLVWAVASTGLDGPLVYVDALTGAVLMQTPTLESARRREVYDAMHGTVVATVLGGARTLEYVEAGISPGAMPDAETTRLYDTTGRVWTYYWNTFRRDGHDGRGGLVRHHAHFSTMSNNAFWSLGNNATFFMDGLVTDDITGHELTHGLVEKTSRFPYVGWPGALNESFADVFGAMFERANWTIGEGSSLGVIRDMSNPPAHGQPRTVMAAMTWPAGTVPSDANDYLGVHTNSGVFNYVAYLLSDGGTHPDTGIVVPALGRDKVEQIYFRALVWYAGGSSRPYDYRVALRLSAYRFAQHNTHGVTPEDCGAVLNALAAVGIGGVDTDKDCFADTVDNCPMVANFDQADANHNGHGDVCEGDAGPMCATHIQRCTMDSDCCNSAPSGTWICELGQCVDGAMCVRVQSACTTATDCCEGVRCNAIGTTDGPKRCCGRNADICTSKDGCCGAMECTSGHCVCRMVGEACVTTLDCCGASFCSGGVCATM